MENIDRSEQATEYIYKEYVRLTEICTSFVRGSFEDIKLYGAIGSVFAWGPIAGSKLFEGGNIVQITFLGFFAILTISIVLFLVNSMKQSLVEYYLQELHTYEQTLRTRLELDGNLFQWSVHYPRWRSTEIKKIGLRLVCFVLFMLIVFPAIVLYHIDSSSAYVWIYVVISIVFFAMYFQVAPTALKRKK